ncbi:hypothetical protein EON62_05445, partial [archaeon]
MEALQPGDILLSVNGVEVTHFTPLEEAMDHAQAVTSAWRTFASMLGTDIHHDVASLIAWYTHATGQAGLE